MMVKAICDECGREYQLEPTDKLSDFQCECGGELTSKKAVFESITTKKQDKQHNWKEHINAKNNEIKSQKINDNYELNVLFKYDKTASRIELFVRIFYAIPIVIILFFYSIITGILTAIQWIIILILGKRSEGLNEFIKGYLDYNVHLISYFSLMTDKRPGITPKKVEIYEIIEKE